MGLRQKCIICGNNAELGYDLQNNLLDGYQYYHCPSCGRYIIPETSYFLFDENLSLGQTDLYDKVKLGKYLIYNKIERRNAFIGTQSAFEAYVKIKPDSEAFLVTKETVENWYPKTFAEKIDYLLLNLNKHTAYDGDYISIHILDDSIFYSGAISQTISENDKVVVQFDYVAKYLKDNDLINAGGEVIQLTPKALDRVYELQKYQVNNKNVFIAMSFNPAIEKIYNAIELAIRQSECEVVSMKHRIHNKQIVPEMLRLIRESKVLVMDISEPNFGAYYEAGYAQGLGKEVIFTCKSSIMKKDKFPCNDKNGAECELLKKYSKPHFDIAQKQILVWENEADLTEQLTEWIKFFIG